MSLGDKLAAAYQFLQNRCFRERDKIRQNADNRGKEISPQRIAASTEITSFLLIYASSM